MNSLSRGFLLAIGVTSIGVTLLSSLGGFLVFRSELEARQRQHLAAYLAERHNNLSRRFSALSEVHHQAISDLERQAAALSPRAAREILDARYPTRPDGTRRSRDEDFTGRWSPDGDYVRGMGAFLSPRLSPPQEELAMAAAFSVVHHFGQGMHSSWDNFYFATPNNKLVMYAPDRPDHLEYYRRTAPADLDFTHEEMMRMVSPAADPERRTRCTALQHLIQDPKGARLATACLTPVYLQGQYVGAFGSSVFLANFLANAVRPMDGRSTSLVVRGQGDVISFPGSRLGRSDVHDLERITTRFDVPAIMRRVQAAHADTGLLTSPDGRNLVAYGRLPGPDWWFLLLYPKSAAAASAAGSAAWILLLGLAAALAQAALILRIARRRIVAPLEALARSCGAGGAATCANALSLRDDELGVLARALDVERENAGLLQASLEARVQERTGDLQAAARETSRFLSTMSRELRTPLNGVIAVAEALAARQPDEEGRRMAAAVVASGRRLAGVVADMVDVASLEPGAIALVVAPFDLAGLLDDVAARHRPAAEGKGLHLDVGCAQACAGSYLGDAERISQVLSHYLANAVACTAAGWVSLRADRAGDALRLSVSDTGRGLDAAERAQLFRPASAGGAPGRAADAGAGLGLAVCRATAQAMGGDVSVTSQPGVGSIFTLTLHLSTASEQPPAAMEDGARPARFGGVRILLADSPGAHRDVAALTLTAAGARLSTADDAEEARAALTSGTFDLTIVDADLPGTTLADLVGTLRVWETAAGAPRTPVIAMGVHGRRDRQGDARRAGAELMLIKPISAADLLSAATAAITSPEASRAA